MGVMVWFGGQIIMMAILPTLKAAGVDGLPAKVAQAFQRVAWPAYGLAFFTGIWNILALSSVEKSFAWSMTFGFKFLFVIFSGFAAALHQRAESPMIKGITGGAGFLFTLIAIFMGYVI